MLIKSRANVTKFEQFRFPQPESRGSVSVSRQPEHPPQETGVKTRFIESRAKSNSRPFGAAQRVGQAPFTTNLVEQLPPVRSCSKGSDKPFTKILSVVPLSKQQIAV